MKNIKQLLRDWENEKTKLIDMKLTASELAAFIGYAYNSLYEDEFELLMDDLKSLVKQ